MSASEKLKAAAAYNDDGDRICMACHTNYSMLDRLTPALPQIVALTDAVERYFKAHDRGEQGHQAEVRTRLDELEKALT